MRNSVVAAIMVAGFLAAAFGANHLRLHTATPGGEGFVTDAVVQHCDKRNCTIEYQYRGERKVASYSKAPQRYPDGKQIRVTVFEENPGKAFPEKIFPVQAALAIIAAGCAMMASASVVLVRRGRRANSVRTEIRSQ